MLSVCVWIFFSLRQLFEEHGIKVLDTHFVSYVVMLVDKIKSQNDGYKRISEGMMFFLAAIFGSIGIYAGMFSFRHKTRKWYFLIGIPVIIVNNLAVLYLLYLFFA